MVISIWVFVIVFLAATVFSTFGFGDALLAMPFLSMLLGVKTAAPLMAMSGTTLSFMLLWRIWRHIAWHDTFRLLIAALPGVPLGIYCLKYANETMMQLGLGMVIMGVAVFNLWRPQDLHLSNRNWAYPFGFVGGILGGAYNISGPAVVIYGTLRAWTPMRFVSTLQGFFLPVNIATLLGHYSAGTLNMTVLRYYLYCLPALAFAFMIGTYLRQRFNAERYRRYVFGILLVSGAMLITKSLF